MKCPSCGVEYRDHLGLIGTCDQLQKANQRLKALENLFKCYEQHARDFLADIEPDRECDSGTTTNAPIARPATTESITNEMTTREQFEAWVSVDPFCENIERYPDNAEKFAWPGCYKSLKTDLAWQAWKAATIAAGGTVTE